MTGISFEYFPPRTEAAAKALYQTVEDLAQFQPEFQSVTYGASGSERNGTFYSAVSMQASSKVPTASHLTYTGHSRADIESFAADLWASGIKQIVALRGDDREGSESDQPFSDTPEFIEALLECHPFEIAVACYPEKHPKASSLDADIAVLKAKQDAGASIAITQFFFDNSVFYSFVKQARAAGITIPIVPGVLPIYNYKKVCEMAAGCNAAIPDFVKFAFEDGHVSGSDNYEIAAELLKAQVSDLACAGFEAIHIFTLNKVPLAKLAADTFKQEKLNQLATKKTANA